MAWQGEEEKEGLLLPINKGHERSHMKMGVRLGNRYIGFAEFGQSGKMEKYMVNSKTVDIRLVSHKMHHTPYN